MSWWDAIVNIAAIVFVALYYVWPYSTTGQTLAKRLFGIRVMSIDGEPLNWRKGIVRTLGYSVSALPFGLGYLWAIWDKDGQAWHDKLAGTCVVAASVSPTDLRGTIDPVAARQRQRRWLLAVGLPCVALMVCGVVLISAFVVASQFPTVWPELSESLGFDEDYFRLGAALSERWDDDDSIPTASIGFDRNIGSDEKTEVWLAIELSYTGTCNSSATDPCELLADELAGIVFDNYGKVNELTGIRVVIGKRPHELFVEASDIVFEKSMTIDEWRMELSEKVR